MSGTLPDVDVRAMNSQMVDRLLSASPEPLPDEGYGLRVVATTGRTSGQERRTPLAVVRHAGADHLVSPDPSRDWCRNLAADPSCALVTADGTDRRTAVPIDGRAAAEVVAGYLSRMEVPWALQAFPVGKDASLEEIEAHLDTMTVVRLDPR